MRIFGLNPLYIAAGIGAIAAAAFFGLRTPETAAPRMLDHSAQTAMLQGDMKKLSFHDTARPVPAETFTAQDGNPATLADYRGKLLLVNFWATWCAPCRAEMPMLDDLQTQFGGDGFEVLTIATGRNPLPAIEAFFAEIGVQNLPLHRDPSQKLARAMGVFGLPITVLIDPTGTEIARMQGDAHWNSDSAKAVLRSLIPES